MGGEREGDGDRVGVDKKNSVWHVGSRGASWERAEINKIVGCRGM